MRIPHIISPNTQEVYKTSNESLKLIGENIRKIESDNFLWDQTHLPPLQKFCIQVIANNFKDNPLLDELPCLHRAYLLEILPIDLPLDFTIEHITDEFYWKRKYEDKYGPYPTPSITYRNLFIKKHLEAIIEDAQPQYEDEKNMDEVLELCQPYIKTLNLKQLRMWQPPLTWQKEDMPEKFPVDHIDFSPIFVKLPDLTEFEVIYGMNNVSDKFEWNMFELSVLDCERLGRSVNLLPNLKVLRIHRSKLKDEHIRAFTKGFLLNYSVELLDLSYCLIGDQGAGCLAKIITVHPTMKELDIAGNQIRKFGAEALGFALLHEDCVLESMNLSMNPLGNDGVLGIMRALVRLEDKLEKLSLAATQFDKEFCERFRGTLKYNKSLIRFDISNNYFGDEGAEFILNGLRFNRTLHWLDLRNTGIPSEKIAKINKYLKNNRLGIETIDPITSETSKSEEKESTSDEEIVEQVEEESSSEEDDQ